MDNIRVRIDLDEMIKISVRYQDSVTPPTPQAVPAVGSPLLYLGGADGHAGTITETEEA